MDKGAEENEFEYTEEYKYLLDMNDVPEIPDHIDERFQEMLSAFENYALHAQMKQNDLDAAKDLITRAQKFAYKAHRNQKRKTGEMYIIHPIATAAILVELEVDAESIAAALLHDTIEDTEADSEMITTLFGNTMTLLVEGVTKLNKISYVTKEEVQAENVRKMLVVTTSDISISSRADKTSIAKISLANVIFLNPVFDFPARYCPFSRFKNDV